MIIKDENYFEKKFFCYMGGGDGDGGDGGEADGPVGSGLGPGDTATTGGGNMGTEADGPVGSGFGPNDVATVTGGNRAATASEMADFSADRNNDFFGPSTTNMPTDLAKKMNVDMGLAFNTGLPAPFDQMGYQSLAAGALASMLGIPGLGTMVGVMADDTMRGQEFAGGYGNITAGGEDDGTRGIADDSDESGSEGGGGTTPILVTEQITEVTPTDADEAKDQSYNSIFGDNIFTAADVSNVLAPTNYPLYLDLLQKEYNNPFTRQAGTGTNPLM